METMYNKIGAGDANASALEFDEWCELICRVCDAKTGGARAQAAVTSSGASAGANGSSPATPTVRIEPVDTQGRAGNGTDAPAPDPSPNSPDEPLAFHKMLDTWLSLVLLPALRNAATDRLPPAPEDLAARARLRMGGSPGARASAGSAKAGSRIRVVLGHEGSTSMEEPQGERDHSVAADADDLQQQQHVLHGLDLYHWGGYQG